MKILSLEVEHFGCVRKARVELGPGLNVLYGGNDLGKSTLARAIRAALLLPHSSAAAKDFVSWGSDHNPSIALTLELPDRRIWRIEKRFGTTGGSSVLRESNDGTSFSPYKKGREVEEELRTTLGWGIASPGSRGAPKGLPSSFLATVLLGEQTDVAGVLRQTLDADTDESGKARLNAALAAFAEDPLFKSILEAAQAKVDEAFTRKGNRKRSKTSPFREPTEVVKRVKDYLEQIRERVKESEDAERHLEERQEALDRRLEELDAATERRDRVKAALEQLAARRQVEDALAEARQKLEAEQSQVSQLREREAKLAELKENLDVLRQTRDALVAEQSDLASQEKSAEEAVRLAKSAEAEQARQIRRGELENERLELEAKAKALASEREKAKSARNLSGELAAAETELAGLERAQAEAEAAAQAAQTELEQAKEQRELLDVAMILSTKRSIEAELERLEGIRAEALESRSNAERHRLRASELESQLATDLPTRAELDALRDLSRDLAVAEASLGGGLAVVVERLQSVAVNASADGESVELSGEGRAEFDAKRGFDIEIGDVARISVTAGEKSARRLAAELRGRWEAEAVPILQRLEVDDLEDVAARVDAGAKIRSQIEEALQSAKNLEERADLREAQLSRLGTLQAEVEALGRDLEGKPCEAAETLLDEVGDGDLNARKIALREKESKALSDRDEARDKVHDAKSGRGIRLERIESARKGLAQLDVSSPEEGWEAYEAGLEKRREAIEAERGRVAQELQSLNAEQDAEVSAAEAALAKVQEALADIATKLEEATERLEERRDEANQLEGGIERWRQEVAKLDIQASQDRVNEISSRLAELPLPEQPVSPEDLEAAELAVKVARSEHELARDEVRKAEGALQTVGGQVVREEEESAREALRIAEKREHDVEVEYDAWKLMVEKLREAENTEGQHLGEALSLPVSERFAELTAGRYGKLAVGPNLEAQGLVASGAPRDIDAFSVGTQEQLATLLRLTVAEHLGSTLLLDDHLSQTDPARSAWFRDILRRQADKSQVIVLTCRALDYLLEADMPKNGDACVSRAAGLVRVIDLTRCIQRGELRPGLGPDGESVTAGLTAADGQSS